MKAATISSVLLLFLCVGATSCGGGGGDDNPGSDVSLVTSMFVDSPSIAVSDGTAVHTLFRFDSDHIFDNDGSIEVVVHLPPQISFRSGTGEVQATAGDETVGVQVFPCPNGESFLLFDLNEHDLDTANNPDGPADADATFTANGVSPVTNAVIEAAAGDSAPAFACGTPFAAQAATEISVAQ